MHGNVWEWCRDWHQMKLPVGIDPVVTARRARRVSRGGSWVYPSRLCRCAYRDWRGNEPGFRTYRLGFRLAAVETGGAK